MRILTRLVFPFNPSSREYRVFPTPREDCKPAPVLGLSGFPAFGFPVKAGRLQPLDIIKENSLPVFPYYIGGFFGKTPLIV